ncbi:MAG: SOUL family heme-binding protein [Myxococcota bacterium]
MQRNHLICAASGVAVASALLARWQFARWFTEKPDYDVEQHAGSIEIRRYARSVRAETTVYAESWNQALDQGFKRLARYISGANHPRQLGALGDSPSQPLNGGGEKRSKGWWRKRSSAGEKIEMTTPVTARVERSAEGEKQGNGALTAYTITFTLPKARAPRSLPVPEDKRVHLRVVPARRVAVLRYRGRHTFDHVRDNSGYLQEVLMRAGLSTRGEPEFAGYDAPSTLPWLRRNEVWVELGSAPQRRRLDPVTGQRAAADAEALVESEV